MTHKDKILTYLRTWQPSFVSSVMIEKQATEWGCKGQTIDRRCRELAQEGKIERQMMGKIVWYRLVEAPGLTADVYEMNIDFDRDQFVPANQPTQEELRIA